MNDVSIAPLAQDRIAACVLAVDVDDLTLGRVKAAVRGTEFTVAAVSREEARDRLKSEEERFILLLEWGDDGAAGGLFSGYPLLGLGFSRTAGRKREAKRRGGNTTSRKKRALDVHNLYILLCELTFCNLAC